MTDGKKQDDGKKGDKDKKKYSKPLLEKFERLYDLTKGMGSG